VLRSLYPSFTPYFDAVIQVDKANAINGYILFPDLIQDIMDTAHADIGS